MSEEKYRAIVVDDDPIARQTVAFFLRQEGFECAQAADGNDAMQLLSDSPCDVVVTDLRMPNRHGYALASDILEIPHRPLVVVHTSVDSPKVARDLIALGVDEIVEKPSDYELFAAKLLAMVQRWRSSYKMVGDGGEQSTLSFRQPLSETETAPTAVYETAAASSECSQAESRERFQAARRWIREPNRRILLIDDDESVHNALNGTLDEADAVGESQDTVSMDVLLQPAFSLKFDTVSAYGGDEGINLVSEALRQGVPFAIAFVGEQAGLETVERLWQADPQLQVVIIADSSTGPWSELTAHFGIRDQLFIVRKPLDRAEVLQLAVSLTEKWNLSRRFQLHCEHIETLVSERTSEIQHAHQETESILSAISSLLIGVDSDGVIYRWNEAAEEAFGAPASHALGKRFVDLDIEWLEPNGAESLVEQLQQGDVVKTTLKLLRDDSTRVLGLSLYPVFARGEQRGCLCLGTDITKQSQLEQQLQQAQKLEAVGQLAAGVAHELNTPMQYLGDNLDFLQKKVSRLGGLLEAVAKLMSEAEATGAAENDEQAALFGDIRAALERVKVQTFLSDVIEAISDSRDGVLHVSRIVRAMKEFAHPGQEEMTPVDVNHALKSTITVSTNEWKYVADIETNFDASIPLVPALAGELNQVFLNIVVNAAQAIGEANGGGAATKGTITVSTRLANDHVEVSIADTGAGIPDQLRQRIFDPFFTTKEVGKGTGQGLAIAHSVVIGKHGGKLWCDSAPGEGATFYIQLPVHPVRNSRGDELEPAVAGESPREAHAQG